MAIDSFKHPELFNLFRFDLEAFLPSFGFFLAFALVVGFSGDTEASLCIDNSFSLLMLEASCDRYFEICVSLRVFVSGLFMFKEVSLIELSFILVWLRLVCALFLFLF